MDIPYDTHMIDLYYVLGRHNDVINDSEQSSIVYWAYRFGEGLFRGVRHREMEFCWNSVGL